MPIPQPNENESRDEFIARCMTALKDDDMPNDQKVAVCESTYTKHINNQAATRTIHLVLQSNPLTTKPIAKGKALQLTGDLLRTGTWIGLDGVPTRYSPELISRIYPGLVGTPIHFAHKASPYSMDENILQGETIGYWAMSRVSKNNAALRGRGRVFDQRAIKYLQDHPDTKLSIEMTGKVITLPDGSEDCIDATITGGALTDNPACKSSEPVAIRQIALQSDQITLERGKQNMAEKELVNFDANGKNDRAEYVKFLETELKELKLPDEDIKKALDAIARVTKTFAIAPPTIEPPKALPAEIAEFVAYAEASGKPFVEAYKEFGITKKINNAAPDNTEELTALKNELESTKTILNQRLQVDNDAVVAEIKTYDTEFKVEKYLEGVKDIAVQKKMLESYAITLKKHAKPINLQLSNEEAKAKVEGVAESMFGDKNVTVESIIGIKTK